MNDEIPAWLERTEPQSIAGRVIAISVLIAAVLCASAVFFRP